MLSSTPTHKKNKKNRIKNSPICCTIIKLSISIILSLSPPPPPQKKNPPKKKKKKTHQKKKKKKHT